VKHESTLDDIGLGFYRFELPAVVMMACIGPDIGNPTFGHCGKNNQGVF
jgi:dGTP triphosphohydrolase